MLHNTRLLKNGQITISKEVQDHLRLEEGDYLFIYRYKNSIIIAKEHDDYTSNQCVFGNKRISIPSELRNLVGITTESLLKVQPIRNQDKLIITVTQPEFLKEA